MSFCSPKTKDCSCRYMGMTSKWLEDSTIWLPCERNCWKMWIWKNQHHFLIMYVWDALNVKVNQTETLSITVEKMFESWISATATEKLPEWEKLDAKTVAWSLRHGRTCEPKCVGRYCERAKKKTGHLYPVSTPCLDDHNFKKEELETIGELSDVCSQIVLKCLYLYLARIGRLDILWSVNKLARSVTKMDKSWWHTFSSFDILYSSHEWSSTLFVMWVIQLNTADWVYSKTQILLVTLKIRNQL